MAERIGVLLSGCGVMDGAEIHEAVLTLLAVDRAGAEAVCLAPNVECEVVNHLTNQPTGERRNVLVEAARIARGRIRDVAAVTADAVDAAILPGGYGAAKNLSTFAGDGARCAVQPDVAMFLKAVHAAGKPIGAICIAPAVIAQLFGGEHPVMTIGNDRGTAAALEAMGARHRNASCAEAIVDGERLIVTTPAYMLAGWVAEAWPGIERLVNAVIELVRQRRGGAVASARR